MREKELNIFLEALFALKNAAAYTAGDLYALLSLCRENAFLGRVWVLSENMDCTAAFKAAAHAFLHTVEMKRCAPRLSTGSARPTSMGKWRTLRCMKAACAAHF